MIRLRRVMLEELQRNYAKSTVDDYIRAVKQFAKHFRRSPDQLNENHVHISS